MAQNTVGDLMLVLEHHCIDAMVFCRVAIHNDIRRHIFCNAATCLNQHPTTDVAVLMQDDIAAQDRAVVYAAVACVRRPLDSCCHRCACSRFRVSHD